MCVLRCARTHLSPPAHRLQELQRGRVSDAATRKNYLTPSQHEQKAIEGTDLPQHSGGWYRTRLPHKPLWAVLLRHPIVTQESQTTPPTRDSCLHS